MVATSFPGVCKDMGFFELVQALAHALHTVSLDDGNLSVLAMLAGVIGGWMLTGLRQPKAKKIKADRKNDSARR
jgi:hypothetical protein